MTDIFAENAERYWAAGLPAIPLVHREKRPAVGRWQMYAETMPTPDEQEVWLNAFPNGNIGMPMGPASGLVAIDIDTDDPLVLAVLDAILPPSPWQRRGKKGRVQVYRYAGQRTQRVKNSKNEMICEILSKGTQIVLPPSIHPDTQRPYEANVELLSIMGAIPTLPADFDKILRAGLAAAGIEMMSGSANGGKTVGFVPAGARDNQMVWMAGLLARAVLRGERTLIEALGEIEVWLSTFVAKVVGDDISADKARGKVIEFLMKDVRGEKRATLPLGWDNGLTEADKEALGLNLDEEDESWTPDRIMKELAYQFETNTDPSSKGFVNAVKAAVDRMARANGTMTQLDEHRIIAFMSSQSQGTLSRSAIQKELNNLRRGELEGRNHTELAEAVVRYLSEFGEIRFDAGQFWQWRGACWEPRSLETIKKVIATEFGHYDAARKQSDHNQICKLIGTLQSEPLKRFGMRGINFANGFLTEDMQLLDHHPDQGMTYILPYRYLPELTGHMPMFNQFMQDSWGADPDYMDKVSALQEAMGVTLFAAGPVYQRALLLYGKPGSGKSRIPALLRALLPANSTCSIPPQDWADKFLPAQMFGKIYNFAGELSESRMIPGDTFKGIIAGETMTAQFKNQSPFEFEPTTMNVFCSNFLPKTKDTSAGFSRRWLILQFNHKVNPLKKIPGLEELILETEAEAIIAWAVQGYLRVKEQGDYTQPVSHMACVEEMDRGNNTVNYYLSKAPGIKFSPDHHVASSALHKHYWAFCLAMGVPRRASQLDFEKMMIEMQDEFDFLVMREGSDTVYKGIKIEL